ncbi:hypothetical protein [Streptomyces sp. NPDC101150]|uniref:hypothetical protein n=1 Tax=Streptomyces sp. NPDC101150 TaxID=3366114 RepID=UPI003815A0FA
MLDFKLMPRPKNIGSARLYRPAAGEDDNGPNLAPVLSTKTINAWAPPRPSRSCAASPAAAPSTPPTGRSRNSAGPCVPDDRHLWVRPDARCPRQAR